MIATNSKSTVLLRDKGKVLKIKTDIKGGEGKATPTLWLKRS